MNFWYALLSTYLQNLVWIPKLILIMPVIFNYSFNYKNWCDFIIKNMEKVETQLYPVRKLNYKCEYI